MPVLVFPAWGGYRVSHMAADTLASAQADAAVRGEPDVGAADILAALLTTGTDSDSHARAALRLLAAEEVVRTVIAEEVGQLRTETTRDRIDGTSQDSALPAALARSDELRSATGDPYIGTLHLIAAIADDTGSPTGVAMRGLGLTADRLLAAGARCRDLDTDDDMAFGTHRSAGDGAAAAFSVPVSRPPDEHRTHTTQPLSPLRRRLFTPSLPVNGGSTNTPLGLRRTRHMTVASTMTFIVTMSTWLAIVSGTGVHRSILTRVLMVLLLMPSVDRIPLPFCILSQAIAVALSPPLIKLLICVGAVSYYVHQVLLIRMKRVDMADPDYGIAAARRKFWREVVNASGLINKRYFGA